jgi:tetratricopeptide (TPR) repeat protein
VTARLVLTAVATLAVVGASRWSPVAACEHGGGPPPRPARPATLMRGLGDWHHPIATTSPEAQRFFDQGLRLVYAFNHDEAVRSFARAAELDPKAPMPAWGIALALGPNINLDVDPAREQAAYAAVQKAGALAADGRADERAYVAALARRYSDDPDADLKVLATRYAQEMRALAQRYPDDLDAATLYAESLMDLRPWQLWTADGRPAEGTEEILAVLEGVLRRDPRHLGANHYYIHAVEASPHPERALPCARRLATLAPAAGHLVHMPAHVYMRTGDYDAAVRANEAAVEADRAYLRRAEAGSLYPLLYSTHNLHFLAAAAGMAGRSATAARAAAALAAQVTHLAPAGPMAEMAEYFAPTPLFVALRFGRWDTLVRAAAPDPRLGGATALWHFARGVAFAASGAETRARAEREAFDAVRKALPPGARFNLNRTDDVLGVARAVLDARLAQAAGDREQAIAAWRRGVEREDGLVYDEPPAWYYPVRESLGAALFLAGRPDEAERVFRDDLARNPRNGRSLFGLEAALRAQGKPGVDEVEREFRIAWAGADVRLRMDLL